MYVRIYSKDSFFPVGVWTSRSLHSKSDSWGIADYQTNKLHLYANLHYDELNHCNFSISISTDIKLSLFFLPFSQSSTVSLSIFTMLQWQIYRPE